MLFFKAGMAISIIKNDQYNSIKGQMSGSAEWGVNVVESEKDKKDR